MNNNIIGQVNFADTFGSLFNVSASTPFIREIIENGGGILGIIKKCKELDEAIFNERTLLGLFISLERYDFNADFINNLLEDEIFTDLAKHDDELMERAALEIVIKTTSTDNRKSYLDSLVGIGEGFIHKMRLAYC